ncbi:hypothetical protein EJB05_57406, partial [Eragrostis curvula]
MESPAACLGFLLLTGNSIIAIGKSRGDTAATIFVITSYACLVLLFYLLRRFEAAAPGSATKDPGEAWRLAHDDAAYCHVLMEGRRAHALACGRWDLVDGCFYCDRRLLRPLPSSKGC